MNYLVDKRLKIFFTVYLFLNSLAFAIQSLLPSYIDYKQSEALSTRVDDGPWCDPQTQGINLHCFGDFYYNFPLANIDNPWGSKFNPYPPLATFFYKPFVLIENTFPGSRYALALYLLLSIACIVFPTLHSLKNKNISPISATVLIAVSITAAPAIMAFDRGNIQLILIPFVYLFCISVLESRENSTIFWGIILILFKPQFALLGLIFLSGRNWKAILKWVVYGFSSFLATFILYPRDLLGNIADYFSDFFAYQNFTNAGSLEPANLSLASTWSTIERFIVTLFPQLSEKDPIGKWNFYSNRITLIIIIMVICNFIIYGEKRSKIQNLLLVLCLPIILPNVVFSYYLCLLLPILLIALIEFFNITKVDGKVERFAENGYLGTFLYLFEKKSVYLLFSASFFFLFIPWGIPWKIFHYFESERWSTIGINWFIGQVFLQLLFFALLNPGAIIGSFSIKKTLSKTIRIVRNH